MLYVGWMELGWMVIIGNRQSKSTFGANNVFALTDMHKSLQKVFNKVKLLQYFLLIDLHEQFPSLNWHRYCRHKIFSEYFSQEYCLLFDLHRLDILEPCDNPVPHCLTLNLCQSVQSEQGIVKTSDNIQTRSCYHRSICYSHTQRRVRLYSTIHWKIVWE